MQKHEECEVHETPSRPTQTPPRDTSWRMFDTIAGRYDALNRLLSFRRDVAWRRMLANLLPPGDHLRTLDLATGTADVLLALKRFNPRVASGVGVDMSRNMLRHAKDKIAARGLSDALRLVRSNGVCMGLADASFDAVTISFGIRNMPDALATLHEIRRVLRPGGRALILEFALPKSNVMRALHLFYLRHVLPHIGGLASGNFAAYRYLNTTIETFPYGEEFCALMREAGFRNVVAHTLTFGAANLYQGDA